MEPKICCSVFAALQILSLVSATSRSFAPGDDFGVNKPGRSLQLAEVPLGSKEGLKKRTEGLAAGTIKDEHFIGKIGSSRPSCERKCYGCTPCEAIQVPTTSQRNSRLVINFANYEPEGWRCKCGPSFYSP